MALKFRSSAEQDHALRLRYALIHACLTDPNMSDRICGHCKERIKPGQLYYTIPTPTGDTEVHASCLAKGTPQEPKGPRPCK